MVARRRKKNPKSKGSEISTPAEAKHLAELDWVGIVVNPVDGVVVLMDSKKPQDVLRQSVRLEKEFVRLVIIYAWKLTSEERARPTPNWTKALASVIGRQEDEAEQVSGPDPTDDTPAFSCSSKVPSTVNRRD